MSEQAFTEKWWNSKTLLPPKATCITRLPQSREGGINMLTVSDLKKVALPLAPIAYESRGALCHALIVVNHKPLVFTCFSGRDFGAELLGHAAPALELVGVGRAGGHADPFVVVVATGHASSVVVGCCAAPQALRMATLVLVCAGSLATWAGAHCKKEGEGSELLWSKGNGIIEKPQSAQIYVFIAWALGKLCRRVNSFKTDCTDYFFPVSVAWKYLFLQMKFITWANEIMQLWKEEQHKDNGNNSILPHPKALELWDFLVGFFLSADLLSF